MKMRQGLTLYTPKPYTAKEKLWLWCKTKRLFNSVDIIKYGLDNYNLRAHRSVREWCEEGKLRRIPKEEKILRGLVKQGNKNIGWYEIA